MRRFFVDHHLTENICITGEDAHHIVRVLRMKVGDLITIVSKTDGQAGTATITGIKENYVEVTLNELDSGNNESPVQLILAQALPKSDKMDYIIQKAVELGVTKIIPLETEFCITHYDASKKQQRQQRWQKIAAEAAKQCGRNIVPVVEAICSLTDFLVSLPANSSEQLVIMLYEKATGRGLKQVFNQQSMQSFVLLVGPEGGFSNNEAELCRKYGAEIVTLGPRILRTETAAVVGVAVVMYHFGDIGGGL